jgi:CMP-2-keto-3-deoxyoctulosonic acid synthetase
VTGKDSVEANKQILTFNGQLKRVRYGIVVETTTDDIHMAESEMLTIAAQDKKIANLVPSGAVVAVITERDFAFGLARIWESFIEHTGWEIMTFRA